MSRLRRYRLSFEETIEYYIDLEARSSGQALRKVEQMRDEGSFWDKLDVQRSTESNYEVVELEAQS